MVKRDARPLIPVKVLLAEPRGFCAGVERAIHIVEQALERHGRPVYVRHEIVHNRRVVERLERLGAVFVENLEAVPDDRPVVFSAHGVPEDVLLEAERRELVYFDATCPLVSKVHTEARRQHARGRHVILIGHAGHPEVIGTMGQLPPGAISLVETPDDVAKLAPSAPARLAFVTQTTLSVADTAHIIAALRERFPDIEGPHKDDICYATTNRQEAVDAIAAACDIVLVVGSPNSSNSQRLKEVALKSGANDAVLIEGPEDIDWSRLGRPRVIGLTSGASAPEDLVQAVLEALGDRFAITIETVATSHEDVTFKLPSALRVA